MSSRVKPIEEPTKENDVIKELEVKNQHEGHAHNDMLSPYR